MSKGIKLILLSLLFSVPVYAAHVDSSNVKVQLISVWASSGDVLLQTNPRHNITGLGCGNDFWLVLDKDQPGYDGILSLLLSAQAQQTNITVRAVDDSGPGFCRLERVVTQP